MKYSLFTIIFLLSLLKSRSQDLGWSAHLGGTSADYAYAVLADSAGNVYTTGSFEGFADLDPGPEFNVFGSLGDADAYVSKLDADGHFLWSIRIGGPGKDVGVALAIDQDGNLYVTGYFNGTADFDPGTESLNLTSAGNDDIFLAKYDSAGNVLWAKRIGGIADDHASDIAIDTAGQPVLVGHFNGTADFDPGAGSFNLTSAGVEDIFIAKYDEAGNLIWANQTGSINSDVAMGVVIDPDNSILATGHFSSTVDFDPGIGMTLLSSNGLEDAFIWKLNEDADIIWAVSFGAEAQDEGTAIHTDTSGRVYVAGFFEGEVDFEPGPGVSHLTSNGEEDIFITVFNADGSFVFGKQLGGPGLEKPHAIDTDTTGNIYTSGYFSDTTDFDPGMTKYSLIAAGGLDAFVTKISPTGEFIWAVQMGGTLDDLSLDMTVDDTDRVYVAGYFSGTADFNPGPGISNISAFGFTDIFVVALDPCEPRFADINVEACDRYTSPDGLESWTVSGTYVDTLLLYGGCDSIITIQLTIINSTSSEVSTTACDSFTSPDGLELWTVSGTYLDTIPNAVGCDSIITVQLTILNSTSSEIFVTACDSYRSPDGLIKWSFSGTYLDTLINAVGCDSIITVQLTIINSTTAEIIESACDSYSSPDGLEIWTVSGTYVDTLLNEVGCDSIVTIDLTIFNSSSSIITEEACDSYTSPSGLYTWSQSGIYIDTIANTVGCDSIMTINLTINESSGAEIDITACDSLVSSSGLVWSTTGVYNDTIPNAVGCDSLITINLTIINSSASEITVTACDSFGLSGGTQIWTESGTYEDIIPNAVGCDSIITVNLTILISPSTEIIAEACNSYVSPTGAQIWTETGTYQEIIPLAGDCDSIITVFLTIHYSDTVELNVTACESYLSPDGTETWTESGTYLDTIPTSAGCDSFITIVLTIVPHSASEISISACDSYSLIGGSQTWTESGIYQDTIPNAVGCDSVVTVNLTINVSPSSELTVEACDSYTSPSGAQTWTESGVYNEYFPVGGECDSIVTFNLTILQSTADTIEVTACDSYPSPDGTMDWTESGVYYDTISNVAGCDTILTIYLTILTTPTSALTIEACDRYTLPGGTQTWTESGVYQEIFATEGECDSIVTLTLTINQSTSSEIVASACGSYLSPSTNYQWTESGIYLDTISNAAGCDSLITINLTIILIDVDVTLTDNVLTSVMTGASYQWIDCDNGNQPIDGETAQQFEAGVTGNYAVVVSSGGCTDTSDCYNVIVVGTKDVVAHSELKLYPNPARNYFVIEPGRQIGIGMINVLDIQGRTVYTAPYRGEDRVVVPFEWQSGIYVVTLTSSDFRMLGKMVVE